MSNEISHFNFKGFDVRVVMRGSEPWFVGVDVCKALGIENNRNAISSLDADEKSTVHNADSRPGQPGAKVFTIVSESGLFALIFKSRKPEARAFRKWVTSEVLPAIFKTGHYSATPVVATTQPLLEIDPYEEENKWLINRVESAQLQVDNALKRCACGLITPQQANSVAALGGRQIELVRLQLELIQRTAPAGGGDKP